MVSVASELAVRRSRGSATSLRLDAGMSARLPAYMRPMRRRIGDLSGSISFDRRCRVLSAVSELGDVEDAMDRTGCE